MAAVTLPRSTATSLKIKLEAVVVVVLTAAALTASAWNHPTPYNNYTLLADAFLHGHIWINWPGEYIDAVSFHGFRYIIEAPFPAIAAIPFVLLFGPDGATQEIVAILVGTGAMAVLWMLFARLGLRHRLWLCAFVFAGTDLWWCSAAGGVWYFSPVVATALTVGALCECVGKRRGWLIGALALCAVESRATLLPSLLLYPFLLATETGDSRTTKRNALKSYGAVLALGALAWIAYNEMRWGTWNDIGYALWCQTDSLCTNGLFNIKYLVYESYAFFLRAPSLVASVTVAQYPYLAITNDGLALTFTSPALIIAFWAPRSRLSIGCWLTAILVAIPSFVYYVDGTVQVGMRHALDFEPFLFVLMALAMRENPCRWMFGLIGLSVVVGVWQIWYWVTFMR